MTNCLQITQITSYTRQKTKIPKMTVPQRRAQTGHSSTALSKKQLGAGQCENPATARSSLLFQQPLDTSQQCPQHQGWAGQPQISLEKRKSQNPISGFWREASSSWAPSWSSPPLTHHSFSNSTGRCLCAEPICAGSKKSSSLEIPGQNAF